MKNLKNLLIILFIVTATIICSASSCDGSAIGKALPLIVFSVIAGLALLACLIELVIFKKIKKKFDNKDYEYVVNKISALNRVNGSFAKDYIHYMIAVSAFNLYKDEMFLEHINQIKNNRVLELKYAYLFLYYLNVSDNDKSELNFNIFQSLPNKHDNVASYISGFYKFKWSALSEEQIKQLKEKTTSTRLMNYLNKN